MMEQLLSHSSKLVLTYMGYELFKYCNLKNIEHEVKISHNIDLSFEKLTKDLHNKNVLIASSINKIVNKDTKNELGNIYLKRGLEYLMINCICIILPCQVI